METVNNNPATLAAANEHLAANQHGEAFKLFGIPLAQLKTMVANELKKLDLHKVFDETVIDKIIKNMEQKKTEQLKTAMPEGIEKQAGIQELLQGRSVQPGLPDMTVAPQYDTRNTPLGQDSSNLSMFPSADKIAQGIGEPEEKSVVDHFIDFDTNTTGNIPKKTPPLPSFMDKIEPAKFIVFSTNELAHGGEGLANQPMRLLENPDIKKSLAELWLEKGIKSAVIYVAKAEKTGICEYDYVNQSAIFHEERYSIEDNHVNNYAPANPIVTNDGIEVLGQKEKLDGKALETYLKSSIDVKAVVEQMVKTILQDYFSTNKTKAVEAPAVQQENSLNNPDGPGYGLDITQAAMPMEESKFDVKIQNVIESYQKVNLPAILIEELKSNSKKYLKKTNEEVEMYILEGKEYYLPVEKLSLKTGYLAPSEKRIL